MPLPTFDSTNNEALLELLEKMTRNACEIQEEVLKEILTKNANTEYLKGFLNGYSDKELFNKKVPVVEYEDIKLYIDRIASGEPSQILSAEPITEILLSSGTSGGKRKGIPTTAGEPTRKAFYSSLAVAILNNFQLQENNLDNEGHFEVLNQGKQMNFRFIMPEMTTSGGLVITNVVSSNFRRSRTQNCHNWNIDTSPDEVISCEDVKQSMYSQLLCGLVQRDTVVRIGTTFATGFLRVIKFLEEYWQELCSNIRTGHISDWIIDPSCRKALCSILSEQMPSLADLIEVECKRGSWEGIIKRLWPRTKSVEVVSTGSMVQYIPKLEFYCREIPLVSMYYAASEGFFGLNLKPLSNPYNVSYSLIPWMAYYEFLPLDQTMQDNCMSTKGDHLTGGIVDLANVQTGHHYELVVTTFAGLYRYRVGDILMVTNFHNNAPQFKIVQRRDVVLSIDLDKTTEEDLSKAVSNAINTLEPLGFRLTDYSSYADTTSFPGHYVLFWELQMRENEGVPIELDRIKMEECCNIVEESLHAMYKTLRRRSNVIDPLEIRVVKQGTFDALTDFFLSQGTSLSQYKTPKGMKSDKAIEFLNSTVVERFFSQVLPDVQVLSST